MVSPPSGLVFARIIPPRPLAAATVESLMLRLASDPTSSPLVFEVRSTRSGADTAVTHWLGCQPEHASWLWHTVHNLLPGVMLITKPAPAREPLTEAALVCARPPGLSLSTDRPEQVSTAILSALCALWPGEQLLLQVVCGPRRTPEHQHAPLADPRQSWLSLLVDGQRDAPAAVRAQWEQRFRHAGMATCIRIGVTAEGSGRRRGLLTGLLGGISTMKSPGTFIDLTPEDAAHLNDAKPPPRWEFAPAAVELVGLVAWPLGDRDLPGLPPIHPKLLPVPPALRKPREPERVFAVSNLPGDPAPICLSIADSLSHAAFVGPTGASKTTSMFHLIKADIHAGIRNGSRSKRAVLVMEPKRQLVDDIIDRAVPVERIEDVVILDPADKQVPGFNPLDVGDRDPDVVVDGLVALFAAVFEEGWGWRSQDVVYHGLLTLARVGAQRHRSNDGEPFTLLDLPALFTDGGFRRSVIGHVADDPALGQFWAWYQAQSPQALSTVLAAPMNKLRQYLLRPAMRRILGQRHPRFRLRDVFRDHKIVLVPLNEALIGPMTAQLLGGLIVAEIWSATLERAAEPDPMSRPASVWIDEVQTYLHLPTSVDTALSTSRSMGVGWHLAFQFRAQLPPAMLAAVDSNARSKVIYRQADPKGRGRVRSPGTGTGRGRLPDAGPVQRLRHPGRRRRIPALVLDTYPPTPRADRSRRPHPGRQPRQLRTTPAGGDSGRYCHTRP